ncbi:SlyX family protein [Desulfobacula sp.]|uniref:SlyX family protein n=1 Tax=Desulfobacula sp. TaxID=2593537 RepID=UPI0026384CC9|nr:SlyX family protein [Desulfobacula sp.]
MNEDRLVKIEIKIAFQEKTIKDLNDVLYEQQQEIERLGFIVNTLVKQLKAVSEFVPGSAAPADEQPPHY